MADYGGKEINYDLAQLAMQKESYLQNLKSYNKGKYSRFIKQSGLQSDTQKVLNNLRETLAKKTDSKVENDFNTDDAQGMLESFQIQFEKSQEENKVPLSFIRKDITDEEGNKPTNGVSAQIPDIEAAKDEIESFSKAKTNEQKNEPPPFLNHGISARKTNILKDAYKMQ